MYHYTPKKSLLKRFLLKRKKGYSIQSQQMYTTVFIKSLLKNDDRYSWFEHYWPHVNYYSDKKLQFVPVSGQLFSVDFFDEEIVD